MLVNEVGWDLDLSIGSPAMLKHYLAMAHCKTTCKELAATQRKGVWKWEEAIN